MRPPQLTALQHLGMCCCELEAAGMKKVTNEMGKLTLLTILDLSKNGSDGVSKSPRTCTSQDVQFEASKHPRDVNTRVYDLVS